MFTKNRAGSSVEKINHIAQSMNTLTLSQRGSVLIWLIGAMVIMAVLGTGMLYLTTTSTYNQLFFGSHSDAYCAAESGGRYAMSVIRDAYAARTSSSVMSTILSTAFDGKTFTLSNGNSFEIKNVSILTASSTDTITFSSIGTVGSGFMQAKRQISYGVQPANQGGYTLPVNYKNPDMTNFTTPTGWGTSAPQTTGGNTVLAVTDAVPESGGSSQEYRFYAYYSNPSLTFSQYQSAQGGTLGYDAQLKVNVTTDYFVAGLAFRTHALKAHFATDPASNANDPRGFNLTIMRTGGNSTSEGIPAELTEKDSTWKGLLYSTSNIEDNYYIILWADTGMNGVNSSSAPQERLLAYKKLSCDASTGSGVCPFFSNSMESATGWTENPTGNWGTDSSNHIQGSYSYKGNVTTAAKDVKLTSPAIAIPSTDASPPKLTFWHKTGSSWGATETASVQICTDGVCADVESSWTTLQSWTSAVSSFSRVSIPLTAGTSNNIKIRFRLKSSISGNISGTNRAWYIDDVKITSWPTLLVRLEEKNLTTGDDTTRRNIIKAYYSTPTANPIGNTETIHTKFYDDYRTGGNQVGTFNWPAATGSDNKFTIIKWDWVRTDSITTNCSSPMVVDASGTVLTTKYFLTKTSRTVVTTDPFENCGRFAVLDDINYDEVGLNVFGINADSNVYFDDLAINISNGAGANGTGQVIQYP